jgi:hypothetical protein
LLVPGGALLGGDRGEWGGELVFKPVSGPPRVLVDENVHGIFDTPGGAVAFVGLAHMSLNRGRILLVVPSGEGYEAKEFRTLSGAPMDVARTTDGEIVFRTFSGNRSATEPMFACHLLDRGGVVRELPCSSIQSSASPRQLAEAKAVRCAREMAEATAERAAAAVMTAVSQQTQGGNAEAQSAERAAAAKMRAVEERHKREGCPP